MSGWIDPEIIFMSVLVAGSSPPPRVRERIPFLNLAYRIANQATPALSNSEVPSGKSLGTLTPTPPIVHHTILIMISDISEIGH